MSAVRSSRKGSAFFLEMTFLLLFAAATIAVVFSLMGTSVDQARYNERFNAALLEATSLAELKAAGISVPSESEVEGFRIVCSPNSVSTETGQLEGLEVSIYEGDEKVYAFQTAVYLPGGAQ